ncbi:hypothetical protein BJX76DRAFT_318622 [Aspergillus varians]
MPLRRLLFWLSSCHSKSNRRCCLPRAEDGVLCTKDSIPRSRRLAFGFRRTSSYCNDVMGRRWSVCWHLGP